MNKKYLIILGILLVIVVVAIILTIIIMNKEDSGSSSYTTTHSSSTSKTQEDYNPIKDQEYYDKLFPQVANYTTKEDIQSFRDDRYAKMLDFLSLHKDKHYDPEAVIYLMTPDYTEDINYKVFTNGKSVTLPDGTIPEDFSSYEYYIIADASDITTDRFARNRAKDAFGSDYDLEHNVIKIEKFNWYALTDEDLSKYYTVEIDSRPFLFDRYGKVMDYSDAFSEELNNDLEDYYYSFMDYYE